MPPGKRNILLKNWWNIYKTVSYIQSFLLCYKPSIKKDQCYQKSVIFRDISLLVAKFFTQKIWEMSPSKKFNLEDLS